MQIIDKFIDWWCIDNCEPNREFENSIDSTCCWSDDGMSSVSLVKDGPQFKVNVDAHNCCYIVNHGVITYLIYA